MLVKRLHQLIQAIKFKPNDPYFKVLIDDSTSVDYCITKAQEMIHHIKSGTTEDKVQDLIILIRVLLIAYHKVSK